MIRRAAVRLVRPRITPRIPFVNHPLQAFPTITSCSRIRAPVAQSEEAAFGTGENGWSISGLPAVSAFSALKVNLRDYHLIIIYYYERSSVYQLNIAIPQRTNVKSYICNDKIYIECEDSHLTEFLSGKLKNISRVEERKLCLKIAKFCGGGQIRGIHTIDNPYNSKSFIAEVEVGTLKNWAENHGRPYHGPYHGERVKEDFDDGVMIQLYKGKMTGSQASDLQ